MSMIFVFGSNLAGIHGKGAARHAVQYCGARYHCGTGPQGTAYALPTKDERIHSLPLEAVRGHVAKFIEYATAHPELQFQVTRVGCGLAGFSDDQILPLFDAAPSNCLLPGVWEAMRRPGLVRLIVAGSRDFSDDSRLGADLDLLTEGLRSRLTDPASGVSLEVVSGAARGADKMGEQWALSRGIPVKVFPADWNGVHRKAAGFVRNQLMAWYGTHLAAFWDGVSPGTAHMVKVAGEGELATRVFRTDEAASAPTHEGINIASNERGLGGALTNPTELARQKGNIERQYAVVYAGTAWPDAESAYKSLRKEGDDEVNDKMMVQVLAAKFQQHPDLGRAVTARGGVAFLVKCTHFTRAHTPRSQSWEGSGQGSRFIRNLIAGYELSLIPGDYSGARQLSLL